jgi:hypothetical protein
MAYPSPLMTPSYPVKLGALPGPFSTNLHSPAVQPTGRGRHAGGPRVLTRGRCLFAVHCVLSATPRPSVLSSPNPQVLCRQIVFNFPLQGFRSRPVQRLALQLPCSIGCPTLSSYPCGRTRPRQQGTILKVIGEIFKIRYDLLAVVASSRIQSTDTKIPEIAAVRNDCQIQRFCRQVRTVLCTRLQPRRTLIVHDCG